MTHQEELSEFLAIKNELLSLLESLDDERLNRVPFAGSWTAGQLGEHMLKSYQAIDLSKVRAIPAQPNGDGKSPQIDAVFLDFTTKHQAPDFIVPATGRISGRNLVDNLRKTADAIAAFAGERDLSFTCQDFEILGFGDLTAQEWIHFLAAHSKRHVRQLRKILGNLPIPANKALLPMFD